MIFSIVIGTNQLTPLDYEWQSRESWGNVSESDHVFVACTNLHSVSKGTGMKGTLVAYSEDDTSHLKLGMILYLTYDTCDLVHLTISSDSVYFSKQKSYSTQKLKELIYINQVYGSPISTSYIHGKKRSNTAISF